MSPAPAIIILIQILPVLIQYAPEIIRALADFWEVLTHDERAALERLATLSEAEKVELMQTALLLAPRDTDVA